MDKNSTSNDLISRAIDFYSWTMSISGKYYSIQNSVYRPLRKKKLNQ